MFYKNILDYTTGQFEIWFMADLHLNHSNILKHSGRPYLKVSEMNKDFIDQLHQIKENDYLFDLGDLFWKTDPSQIENVIKNNIKTKHFWKILGNHDKESMYRDKLSKYFEGISESLDLSIKIPGEAEEESKVITLSLDHYPKVSWNNKPRGSLMIHGHCVDQSTEILTLDGWKFYNEINIGDNIYSYNSTTDKLEITKIDKIIINQNYSGKYYNLESRTMSMSMTSEHVIPYLSNGKKYKEKTASDCYKKLKRINLFRSFNSNLGKGIGLNELELKLYILLAADGSISNKNLGRLRFKKKRKINYSLDILDKLGISYRIYPQKDLSESINFTIPESIMKFNIKGLDSKLLECTREQCQIILDTYINSDGYKNNNSWIIYSSKEEEIDLLQHLFTINGFLSKKSIRSDHGFSKNNSYELHVNDLKTRHCDISELKEETSTDKLFWCIKTSNQNFICRRNGFSYLTGNCHGNIDEYNEKSTDLRVDVGVDGKLADGKILVPLSKIINYFNQKTDGLKWSAWSQGKCKNL